MLQMFASLEILCIFVLEKGTKKITTMKFTKPTTEQKRKDLADGGYIIMERRVKIDKSTGRKLATGWSIGYDSRRGY